MFAAKAIASLAAMGSLALVAAAPASSQVSISLPTGSAAITAAPAVPTFPVTGISDVVKVAAASGSASVLNSCPFEVYIYVCDQSSCGGIINVGPNGGTYSAPYIGTVNDGVSIKIGTESGEVEKPILQLEYTISDGLVYFDLSEVNGNPFGAYGFSLTDSAGMDMYCAPPGTECSWVFTTSSNGMVYADPDSDSIGVTLCG